MPQRAATAAPEGALSHAMRPRPARVGSGKADVLMAGPSEGPAAASGHVRAAPGRAHTPPGRPPRPRRSEEHTSELQSQSNLVCRLLLEKKKNTTRGITSASDFRNPTTTPASILP